jgi:antitoxin (DNA-binding transcriptional repressor) of toxin-antitoxin stability system
MTAVPDRHLHTISVGMLLQNPTQTASDVRDGAESILTDRGRPVAQILPYTGPNWLDAHKASTLLSEISNPEWAEDIQQAHADVDMGDPFTR